MKTRTVKLIRALKNRQQLFTHHFKNSRSRQAEDIQRFRKGGKSSRSMIRKRYSDQSMRKHIRDLDK